MSGRAAVAIAIAVAVAAAAGCHRPADKPAASSSPPAVAGTSQRVSRGFGAGTPAAQTAGDKKGSAAAATEPTLPAAWQARAMPADGVAVYVDDDAKPRATLPTASFATPKPLTSVFPGNGRVRSELVHGDSGDEWIAGGELAHVQLRLNHRGKIKLEPIDAATPHGAGKRPNAPPTHAGRDHEVREVGWIEVRTAESPRVAGEP